MVFTVKPGFMPSHEGSLHWKIKEVIARVSLDAYTSNNLLVSSARLIFQEIMLEQKEVSMERKASHRWTKMAIWRMELGLR
jgi:hypothetical protein